MAQWSKGFTGLTHETKVQDVEVSLRNAIETLNGLPETERPVKMKSIQSLAERLLASRLKALRARKSALTEPWSNRLEAEQASYISKRIQTVEAEGIEGILNEFGVG